MHDFDIDSLFEHRLEARVARLTVEVNSIISSFDEHSVSSDALALQLKELRDRQNEIISVLNMLTVKYGKIENHYEEFSAAIIERIKGIRKQMISQDQRMDVLTGKMSQLSLN